MTDYLDSLTDLRASDPQDMLGWVERFPEQCADAWDLADRLELPKSHQGKEKIAILGMGGSAIGGDMLAALMAPRAHAVVTVVRGYGLPAWVDERTLAIASSYSGNTEETLSAFQQALDRGAAVVALTTGGTLARVAAERGVPLVTFPGGGQPRAALGYSLILLLGIVKALGYYSPPPEERAELAQVLSSLSARYGPEMPEAENPAKQYARMSHNRVAITIGAGHMAPVARRWKTQFNENSKQWATYEEMPEADHNTITGALFPRALGEHVILFTLESDRDHPRVKVRWQITTDIFRQANLPVVRVTAPGTYPLTQMLGTAYLGDFITVYQAFLNGQDPSAVEAIVYLKQALAERA